jgi:hypothetical protein
MVGRMPLSHFTNQKNTLVEEARMPGLERGLFLRPVVAINPVGNTAQKGFSL